MLKAKGGLNSFGGIILMHPYLRISAD